MRLTVAERAKGWVERMLDESGSAPGAPYVLWDDGGLIVREPRPDDPSAWEVIREGLFLPAVLGCSDVAVVFTGLLSRRSDVLPNEDPRHVRTVFMLAWQDGFLAAAEDLRVRANDDGTCTPIADWRKGDVEALSLQHEVFFAGAMLAVGPTLGVSGDWTTIRRIVRGMRRDGHMIAFFDENGEFNAL